MKIRRNNYLIIGMAISMFVGLNSCKEDNPKTVDPGESTTELLAKKFATAPNLDGDIDEMWGTAQRLVGTVEVPDLAARGTYLNSDGEGKEEDLGLFEPYSGETYDFTFRSGYTDNEIFFLLEWGDEADSKDRTSWYFDASAKLWKAEHKYANNAADKFYEDKFAMLFPIGNVTGFNASTCYAVCHQNLDIVKDKDKHTRHYTSKEGEKIDMWHWKRVRCSYSNTLDDQRMVYADPSLESGANGRKSDAGEAGYSNNSQTLTVTGGTAEVSVPLYVIPGGTDYYWISEDQLGSTAKMVTAVDENGVLSYDGGTIDPADGGYEQGTGNKRFPSVITSNFTGERADISVMAKYTGTGWICEFSRKLNTGDEYDVVFDPAGDPLPFGLAIFNNAAIAHAIKPNLTLKFE